MKCWQWHWLVMQTNLMMYRTIVRFALRGCKRQSCLRAQSSKRASQILTDGSSTITIHLFWIVPLQFPCPLIHAIFYVFYGLGPSCSTQYSGIAYLAPIHLADMYSLHITTCQADPACHIFLLRSHLSNSGSSTFIGSSPLSASALLWAESELESRSCASAGQPTRSGEATPSPPLPSHSLPKESHVCRGEGSDRQPRWPGSGAGAAMAARGAAEPHRRVCSLAGVGSVTEGIKSRSGPLCIKLPPSNVGKSRSRVCKSRFAPSNWDQGRPNRGLLCLSFAHRDLELQLLMATTKALSSRGWEQRGLGHNSHGDAVRDLMQQWSLWMLCYLASSALCARSASSARAGAIHEGLLDCSWWKTEGAELGQVEARTGSP